MPLTAAYATDAFYIVFKAVPEQVTLSYDVNGGENAPEDNKKDESKPVSTHPAPTTDASKASAASHTAVSSSASTTPQTGDNSAIVLMSSLLILGIVGFVSLYVYKKKRNAN